MYLSWWNVYNSCRTIIFLLTFLLWGLRIRLRTNLWNLAGLIRLLLWIVRFIWWWHWISNLIIILNIRININEYLSILDIFSDSFCLLIHILWWLGKYFLQSVNNFFVESLFILNRYVALYFLLESAYFLQWFFSNCFIMSIRTWKKLSFFNQLSEFLYFFLHKN